MMQRVRVRAGARGGYEILIGTGALDLLGEAARDVLHERARRIVVVSDARVFRLYGTRAVASLRSAGYEVSHWLAPVGERGKTLRSVERALEFFTARGLEVGSPGTELEFAL